MAAKQIELALSLSSSLAKRGFTVANGFDSSGNPQINLGAMTAGSQSAYIRCLAIPSIGTNSVGLTQRSFGPHVIQIVLETSAVANVALLLESAKLPILSEISGRGTRVELYLSANATAPAVAEITSANLKATWNGFNLEFGVMAAV